MALVQSRLPLLFAAMILAWPAAAFAQNAPASARKIAMDVQASTWRKDEKPLDVALLWRESFEAVGFTLVSAPDSASVATLKIGYRERRGIGYSMFYTGPTTAYGTNIDADVRLITSSGEELFAVTYAASTPDSVRGLDVYDAAVEAFKTHPVTRQLADLVGASLGSGEALHRLLPAIFDAKLGPLVQAIVERQGFKPSDPADRAWLAVAQGNYGAASYLGAPTIPALIARGGPRAAVALADIGDPAGVETVLNEALRAAAGSEPNDATDAVAYFNALARFGDAFAIGPLQEFIDAKRDEDTSPTAPRVQEAARDALAKVRARFAAKYATH